MFTWLGRAVTRHPLVFIVGWVLICVLAAGGVLWGYGHGDLFERMENSQSLVSDSESDTVNRLTALAQEGEQSTIVVEGVAFQDQAGALSQFMAQQRADFTDIPQVASELDPFVLADLTSAQAQALMSSAGDGFVAVVTLKPDLSEDEVKAGEAAVSAATDQFNAALGQQFPGAQASQVATHLMYDALSDQVQHDLVRGESIGLPVALILMIVVFGGLLAAGLPLLGAVLAIVIGLGAVWLMTFGLTIDSFILNVISIIGMALSIDYGLLMVSRYREEIGDVLHQAGYPADGSRLPDKAELKELVRQAVIGTIRTAGRTVSFSALTIACALIGLVFMKSSILKTIAGCGAAVTLLAVLMAITVVPALITVAGPILVRPSVTSRLPGLKQLTKAVGDTASDRGAFSLLAHRVHARPWTVIVVVVIILGVMAAPLGSLKTRTNFLDYVPSDSAVAQAYAVVQRDYPALETPAIIVIADTAPEDTADLVTHIKTLPDVNYVAQPTPLPADPSRTLINVTLTSDSVGSVATDDMLDLRDYDPGYTILVGGPAALQHDFLQSIIDDAPWSALVIVAAVFILLFLMTGSLIVPIKALIINSFSLLASLGTTSWIFEHGYLGMPREEGLVTFIVVCGVAFGFGLAMDYEVFLLARIKEFWDTGETNDLAVEHGLQRSGRIITSAAAIIVAVFIGFTFGDMVAIKQIGVSLAITVITDATLVRLLLVPATMTILGKWNWWAPRPLRRLYSRWHLVH